MQPRRGGSRMEGPPRPRPPVRRGVQRHLLSPGGARRLRQAIPRIHRPPRPGPLWRPSSRDTGRARPPASPPRKLPNGPFVPPQARSVPPRDRRIQDSKAGGEEDVRRPEDRVLDRRRWLAGQARRGHRPRGQDRGLRRNPSALWSPAAHHSDLVSASVTGQSVQNVTPRDRCPRSYGYFSIRIASARPRNRRSEASRVCARAFAIPAIWTSTVPIISPERDSWPERRPASRASVSLKGRSSCPPANSARGLRSVRRKTTSLKLSSGPFRAFNRS